MDRLDSKIVLNGQTFTFCSEASIDSSYDNLTDQATVIIPKRIRYIDQDGNRIESITRGANALFKIGDPAEMYVGYNTKIDQCFTGYISGVRTKFPLEFHLEDPVYKLKQTSIKKSFDNPQLSELLKEVIPEGIDYEVTAEQNLGKFRINNASPAAVLDELRKKHGIFSFFRNGKLYVGLSVVPAIQSTHRFEFNTPNLINGDNLSYIDSTERKIRVVCKSIDRNNNTLEAEAGDADGETRTLYYNNLTLKELQDTADRLKDELRFSGYEGYFTIFATPLVNHGDIVELINKTIPEQSGGYIVSQVVTTFGWSNGGKQNVYIKQKVYDLIDDGNGNFIQQSVADQ